MSYRRADIKRKVNITSEYWVGINNTYERWSNGYVKGYTPSEDQLKVGISICRTLHHEFNRTVEEELKPYLRTKHAWLVGNETYRIVLTVGDLVSLLWTPGKYASEDAGNELVLGLQMLSHMRKDQTDEEFDPQNSDAFTPLVWRLGGIPRPWKLDDPVYIGRLSDRCMYGNYCLYSYGGIHNPAVSTVYGAVS